MLPADAGWAAELMNQRRQVYATYSPVFWFAGYFASAPPVYDPGGPVLHVGRGELQERGRTVASDWYLGRPAPQASDAAE
jgi:hypothetical protein